MMNNRCEQCKGDSFLLVRRLYDSGERYERERCPACKGTGVVLYDRGPDGILKERKSS